MKSHLNSCRQRRCRIPPIDHSIASLRHGIPFHSTAGARSYTRDPPGFCYTSSWSPASSRGRHLAFSGMDSRSMKRRCRIPPRSHPVQNIASLLHELPLHSNTGFRSHTRDPLGSCYTSSWSPAWSRGIHWRELPGRPGTSLGGGGEERCLGNGF